MPVGQLCGIRFNRLDHLVGRDEIHASREIADSINTEVLWLVFLVTVAQGHASRPPTAAGRAARKLADGVKEAMSRIRLPSGGFTTTGDYHTWPDCRLARFALDGSRQ